MTYESSNSRSYSHDRAFSANLSIFERAYSDGTYISVICQSIFSPFVDRGRHCERWSRCRATRVCVRVFLFSDDGVEIASMAST